MKQSILFSATYDQSKSFSELAKLSHKFKILDTASKHALAETSEY